MIYAAARMRELAERRQLLLVRAQQQRVALGQHTAQLAPLLRWADRGWQAWVYLRLHPWIAAIPVLAVTALRPRRVTRTVGRLFMLWRFVPSLRNLLQNVRRPA